MTASDLRTQRDSQEKASTDSQTTSAVRAYRSAAAAALLLLTITASAESQSTAQAASGRTMPVAVPTLRAGSYAMADFRGSAANRQWPLLDGRTASRRFQFVLRDGGMHASAVQCHHLTITGDEARNRTSLDCSLVTSEDSDDQWRLQLAGPSTLDGSLQGRDDRYDVRHVGASEMKQAGGSGRASGYYIYSGDAVIAAVELQGRGWLWIAQDISADQRRAIAATVFALLASHEQRRA